LFSILALYFFFFDRIKNFQRRNSEHSKKENLIEISGLFEKSKKKQEDFRSDYRPIIRKKEKRGMYNNNI
jgi:hypothetical protein